jgi:hypothetical protein
MQIEPGCYESPRGGTPAMTSCTSSRSIVTPVTTIRCHRGDDVTRHKRSITIRACTLSTVAGVLALGILLSGAYCQVPEPPDGRSTGMYAVAPPKILSLKDTPNDAGNSIDITWEISESESMVPGSVIEYRVLRADSEDGEFSEVGAVPSGTGSYSDDGTQPGQPYWYKVAAVGLASEATSAVSGPGISRIQWFDWGRIGVLVLVALACFLVMVFIAVSKRMKGKMFLRRLPVFDAIDEAIGRATEMGKSVLYIMGGLDVDDPQTVASMSILARVAERTASYGSKINIPCLWPMAMSMARETVKESYLRVGRPDQYNEDAIYYLTTDQFGYVAGVDGIMMRERPAANFYLGAFYAESLIFAETGYTIGAIQIAGTAEVDQLPFFVVACDYTLIGEELYAAGASLSGDPVQLGSIRGQDAAKAIFIVLIIVGVILALMGIDWMDRFLTIG